MRLNKPANNERGLWGNERGKPTSQKPPTAVVSALSCLSSASSTQHIWELLAGNRTAVLPGDARG